MARRRKGKGEEEMKNGAVDEHGRVGKNESANEIGVEKR